MILILPDRDLSLAEAYASAEAAGIAPDLVQMVIAEACAHGRVISTGFGHNHKGERHEASGRRERIPWRYWLVLSAVDPANAQYTDAQKNAFEAFASVARNSLTVRFLTIGAESTWDQIAFDRTSFAQFVSGVRASNARRQKDGESDVDTWIARYLGRSNVTFAWKAYLRERGAGAAKKSVFEQRWRIATGGRRRGRPPAT